MTILISDIGQLGLSLSLIQVMSLFVVRYYKLLTQASFTPLQKLSNFLKLLGTLFGLFIHVLCIGVYLGNIFDIQTSTISKYFFDEPMNEYSFYYANTDLYLRYRRGW